MNVLHYVLNASLDDLSYHNESVKIMTRTFRALQEYPHAICDISYTHAGSTNTTIMYTIKLAHLAEVVTIDVNDMLFRILSCLEGAVQNFTFLDYDVTDENYDRYSHLVKLIDVTLRNKAVYWFELARDLRPERFESYLRYKRVWASDITEIHKVMACLSVANDVAKLCDVRNSNDYDARQSLARHLYPGRDLARLIAEAKWSLWTPMNEDPSGFVVGTTICLTNSTIDLWNALTAKGETLANEFGHDEACDILIIREVLALLLVMPFELDVEEPLSRLERSIKHD